MQMYRGLPIITNQITQEEQKGVPHHLIDAIKHHEPPWTVQNFALVARKVIQDIRSRGKLPVVVGGTHYYINALLFEDTLLGPQKYGDDDDAEGGSTNQRFEPEEATSAQFPILAAPTDVMLGRLREVDPAMAERWHPSDRRRIRRSLEIYLTTGRRASDIYAEQQRSKATPEEIRNSGSWEALMFWVYSKPEALYERLNARVGKMADRGLMDEVRDLYDHLRRRTDAGDSVDRTKGIWQSIGFRQLEPLLDAERDPARAAAPEELAALREAGLEDMRVATRQYARSQLRWIRGKTVPELKEHDAFRYLYLLDSSDTASFETDVLAPAAAVCRRFLDGEEMSSPRALSGVADEVLSAYEDMAEKPVLRQRTCETCHITVLEHLWQQHLKGKKHRRFLKHKSRTGLIPYELEPGYNPEPGNVPTNPDPRSPNTELGVDS